MAEPDVPCLVYPGQRCGIHGHGKDGLVRMYHYDCAVAHAEALKAERWQSEGMNFDIEGFAG